MSFLSQLSNLFSRSGRDDNRLQQGMQQASAGAPEKAIVIYDSLLQAQGTGNVVRARALFNRALAHSALKNDQQAVADLEEVMTMSGAPENVLTAARNQLIRVRNRVQRHQARPPKTLDSKK